MESHPVTVDFARIDSHPRGALRFIQIFMRFEFSLKESGYCEQKQKKIDVSWNRFVNERLGPDFFRAVREAGIATTLIEKPPSRQVVRGGALDWEKAAAPVQSCQDLFGAIRRVRNNLFHGGKSGDVDHDRNDKLIAESERVLIEALKADFDLRMMFEGKY